MKRIPRNTSGAKPFWYIYTFACLYILVVKSKQSYAMHQYILHSFLVNLKCKVKSAGNIIVNMLIYFLILQKGKSLGRIAAVEGKAALV